MQTASFSYLKSS